MHPNTRYQCFCRQPLGLGEGKEGTQAARSADFAICQFRYLEKLLLVHGRWNYRRVSLFICYYFYKNCTMVFTEIFFAFFNGFSGQIFFLDWLPMLFNAVWTSWPCIVNSLLDQVFFFFLINFVYLSNNFRTWVQKCRWNILNYSRLAHVRFTLISKDFGFGLDSDFGMECVVFGCQFS